MRRMVSEVTQGNWKDNNGRHDHEDKKRKDHDVVAGLFGRRANQPPRWS